MTIRERLEEAERRILHPRAAFAADSRGRARPEPDDDLRTVFQRDRDRILHAKSFRRLKGKTQVFLAPVGDHYRTRLTHTLEVAQVGRTIARALFLNESLVEAIVMGHDLGHTPFGHAGESTLRRILPGGFHHVRQSLRVVDVLEREGRGLNLTAEVRDGILRHTKGKGAVLVDGGEPLTLEAEIVRIADIVAYVCHDLDDALRAGVVRTWSTGSLGRLFPVRDRFVSWWNPATRLAVQSRLDALEKGESRRLRIRFRRYPGGRPWRRWRAKTGTEARGSFRRSTRRPRTWPRPSSGFAARRCGPERGSRCRSSPGRSRGGSARTWSASPRWKPRSELSLAST